MGLGELFPLQQSRAGEDGEESGDVRGIRGEQGR